MRLREFTLVIACLFVVSPAAAAPTEQVHSQDWFVHIDMIDAGMGMDLAFWTALIQDRVAEANRILQGHQGPVDAGCCVELDPVSVSTFGTPSDGLDMITNGTELSTVFGLGAGAYLVETVHFCSGSFSTSIRGCAQTPGDGMIVSMEADPSLFLPAVIAHERGHNGGLNHVSSNPCELMQSSNGGGCLSVAECNAFIADADTTGGTCECLDDTVGDPPVALGTACTDPSGNGVCSGGLCGDSTDTFGARLYVAGGTGAATGQTPNTLLDQVGGALDWDSLGAIGVEVSGLAYDPSADVLYGIEVLAGDDALITIDPTTGAKTGTIATLTGKADVIALAFDPRGSGDRLLAVEVDDDFFGNTCMGALGLTPPCFSELFEIDPSNGNITILGELNQLIITGGVTGLAMDDAGGLAYGATPAGLASIDFSSCPSSQCPSTALDNRFVSGPSLTWDPISGQIFRQGSDGFSATIVNVFDIGSGESEFERGVDVFTAGAMAAAPIPEPGFLPGLVSGLVTLVWLRGRGGREPAAHRALATREHEQSGLGGRPKHVDELLAVLLHVRDEVR
jgi:hypothetical protein